MQETTMSIIGMVVAAIMMFVIPLTLIADRSDDISQLIVQTTTAEFVDEIIKTGKITHERYKKFIQQITTSRNTYEVEMELKILDENTSKRVTDNNSKDIGNNTYYSLFTSQIEEIILGSRGEISLKHGDAISVTVKNNSQTLSQSLKNFYTNVSGAGSQIIAATASGTIVVDGATYK